MDLTYIYVNFGICYQSYPCQHEVTVTKNTKTKLGTPITTFMTAPKILNLIIKNNVKVKYHELKHFEHYFNCSEHYDLLTKLKIEHNNELSTINVNSDGNYLKDSKNYT